MNYSTLKKVFAVSAFALAGITTASAQDAATTTSTSATTVFGGSKQYRTWSIGLHGGLLTPIIPFGTNDYPEPGNDVGYGAFIKKQFTHGFALKADFYRGKLKGESDNSNPVIASGAISQGFETELHYTIALKGVANLGSVSFLSRTKNVGFYAETGLGWASYALKNSSATFSPRIPNTAGNDGDGALFLPVGLGANFKLSQGIALNLGYSVNFLDNDDLDGAFDNGASNKDRWTYASAGLEFTLGSKSKPSLQWTNPIAVMYDELKDPTLRQEVEALKTRVSTLENTVNQLSADADGDGVSDKFDKEAGSAAGAVVDGSGRTIKFPAADSTMMGNPYGNIQFEFDSSVLKTSSYPALDKVAADLRSNASSKIGLDGHASAEGTESYNVNLSRDRANSVKTYLVNSGVEANRISVKAFGESRPMVSNATEEGRIQNRRVEIKR